MRFPPWPLSLRDPIEHEQALVVHDDGHGLVLIAGCGHPTLERLVVRAESLYAEPVVGVIGGFHYEGQTASDVAASIEFLASRDIEIVALSPHDSGPEVIEAFEHEFPSQYHKLQIGDVIQFP